MHGMTANKKAVATITFMMLLFLIAGCEERTKDTKEELMSLTDVDLEESPEEEMASVSGTKEEEPRGQREAGGMGEKSGVVYVHVCGQVANPGVYPLPSGSRLYEAVEAAGGMLESGAGEQLNQAAQIEDGQQVYVPSKDEVQQGLAGGIHTAPLGDTGSGNTAPQGASASGDGKVNLNTASKEQLMTLSGIGEAKAASIIAYREEHGGFQKLEELMEVEGIKEGVFNKVRDRISIN